MFISEAPPDSRRMTNMLSWYILLTIAIRWPELSIDLRDLDVSVLSFRVFLVLIGYTYSRR